MTTAEHIFCPICETYSLVKHCENSPTCTWHRCIKPGCGAVLDVRKKRGIALAEDGKTIRKVTLGGAA